MSYYDTCPNGHEYNGTCETCVIDELRAANVSLYKRLKASEDSELLALRNNERLRADNARLEALLDRLIAEWTEAMGTPWLTDEEKNE